MPVSPQARAVLNTLNLSTPAGLLVAGIGGARPRRTSDGLIVARGYRRRVPPAPAFTLGNVILVRAPAAYPDDPFGSLPASLREHETRHATQYAVCGGVLMPALYVLAAGWSWLRTGDFASRNAFERDAGLLAGGYRERPIRPLLAGSVGRITDRPSATRPARIA